MDERSFSEYATIAFELEASKVVKVQNVNEDGLVTLHEEIEDEIRRPSLRNIHAREARSCL